MKQKKVIFDTDLGADCDDVMALDFIMAADKCGDCELIGVTYSGDVFNAIPCIYAILREHGYEYIPIGSTEITGTSQRNWDIYATKVVDKFSYPDAPTYETVPSAVSLLRRLLSESEEPVKIISTGFFTNLADLIESGPDEYSPLDGAALLKEKAEEIYVAACNFWHIKFTPAGAEIISTQPPTREYNVRRDVKSAQTFFNNCNVPVIVCQYEVGNDMISGGPMVLRGGEDHADSYSYIVHGSVNGRHSWDPVTAMCGIYGELPWFELSVNGRVTVKDDSITDFIPCSDGMCRVVNCRISKDKIAADIDKYTERLF